jgi:hypothetical protein
MKRIESKAIIQADIHTVWEAIVGIEKYPDWNPFIIAIEAEETVPVVGTEMEFTVRWQDGSTRKTMEVVNAFTPPRPTKEGMKGEWKYYFKSSMRTIGLVKATRTQVVTATPDGATHYHTYEDFRGWGVLFLPVEDIKDGFERQTQALKQYCER